MCIERRKSCLKLPKLRLRADDPCDCSKAPALQRSYQNVKLHRSAYTLASHKVSHLLLEVTERGGRGLGRAEVDAMSEPAPMRARVDGARNGPKRHQSWASSRLLNLARLKLGFKHDLLSSLSSHSLGRRCIGLLATGVFSICVRTAWWRPEA